MEEADEGSANRPFLLLGAAFSDSACSNCCEAARNIWSKSLGADAAEADAVAGVGSADSYC